MKPTFVLDTSVSAAWVLDKQMTPYKLRVLRALDSTCAIVPMLWNLEMNRILRKYAKQNNAGLTPYDALYLQLAVRTSLPLATADEDLMARAQHAGVAIFSTEGSP